MQDSIRQLGIYQKDFGNGILVYFTELKELLHLDKVYFYLI